MSQRMNDAFLKTANTVKLEVLEAALVDLGREWKYQNMYSPYSRLYYVISGEGFLRMQDGEGKNREIYALRPGHLYLIPNGLNYDCFCENRMEKVYFHINVLLPNGMELFYGCKKHYDLALDEKLSAQMKQWIVSSNVEDYFRLQGEIYHAVGAFIKEAGIEDKVNRQYSAMVKGVFDLPQEKKLSASVSEIAAILNVSESTLTKHFRKETGMSIGGYRELLIMSRARQLLAMDNISIGEIASELGFSDQFYFCKYFKQRLHMTPSGYRKRNRYRNN